MTSKKIAIVLNSAWNIYNFRQGLVKELLLAGHSVYCIAPTDEYVDQIISWGATFIPLKHLERKGTSIFSDFLLYLELRSIFKLYTIDTALLYTIKPNIYGSWAAKGLPTKTICTVTGLGYTFIQKGWINHLVKILYHRSFSVADKILFQNKDDKNLFIEAGLGRPERMGIIPGSGIDTHYFAPDHSSTKPKDAAFHFLFIGRLLKDKGIQELIQACEILHRQGRKFAMHIVGGLDSHNPATLSEDALEEWKRQPYVHYHGQVENTKPYLQDCDALVLPSYREGLPRVCLEAMSMAKPLVVTDVPGCRETVIDGQNGFLCEVKNAVDLADKMAQIMNLSSDKLRSMGTKSRNRALAIFDEDLVIAQYLRTIASLSHPE